MSALLVWAFVFGVGAILALTAQPIGAPRAIFAERLRSLRPEGASDPRERAPVFRTRLFENAIRPRLEAAGEAVAVIASRVGITGSGLDAKLSAAGDVGGLPLFLGQKLASFLVGFVVLPLAGSLRLAPPTPLFLWITLGIVGFLLPDVLLSIMVRARRVALLDGLAQAAEYLSLAVSSGLGMEQAIEEAARAGSGPFFDDLRRALKDARIEGAGASRAVQILAERSGVSDVSSLSSAIRLAEQGAPLVQTLRAQARAIRERRRLGLLEAGERAQVRMVLPVGVFILPAFFLLVLYPAAVQLLTVTGP